MMMWIKSNKWDVIASVSVRDSCELAVKKAEELKMFAHYLDLLFVVGKCWLSKNMGNVWSWWCALNKNSCFVIGL